MDEAKLQEQIKEGQNEPVAGPSGQIAGPSDDGLKAGEAKPAAEVKVGSQKIPKFEDDDDDECEREPCEVMEVLVLDRRLGAKAYRPFWIDKQLLQLDKLMQGTREPKPKIVEDEIMYQIDGIDRIVQKSVLMEDVERNCQPQGPAPQIEDNIVYDRETVMPRPDESLIIEKYPDHYFSKSSRESRAKRSND